MPKMDAVRIIIAEDCRADVVLVEETLRTVGLNFELKVFPDGEECARYFKADHSAPDAIILDLNLPRLDGFDLLRVLRGEPRYSCVPVAVLTSSRLAEDRRKSLDLGATAFITKPSKLDEFVETVGTAICRLLVASRISRSAPAV